MISFVCTFNWFCYLIFSCKDCISLLAYEDPSTSCVGYLLDTRQRDIVADGVNVMILSGSPNLKSSKGNVCCTLLEKLLKQLTACYIEGRSLNGQQGEVFNLHDILHDTYRIGNWTLTVLFSFFNSTFLML